MKGSLVLAALVDGSLWCGGRGGGGRSFLSCEVVNTHRGRKIWTSETITRNGIHTHTHFNIMCGLRNGYTPCHTIHCVCWGEGGVNNNG